MTEQHGEKQGLLKRFAKATSEFIYGMSTYETARFAYERRSAIEHVFLLIAMGDLLGIPILRPYYTLRILPYVVPKIDRWKYKLLREKDITDLMSEG